ncbi:MAG TPA: mannitol dehydrogenase family protein [Solirubrobacteraceae bacterium]|jgi:mannitol 2-dehydrogenase
MTLVSSDALPDLAGAAAVPGYDRSRVTAGVVHIGVGGFHRAHQAVYLDRLMAETGQLDWGICGVGVLPADRRMKEALEGQDWLYTVVEKDVDGEQRVRVVGSIVDYLLLADDPQAVVERMAGEAIRIVSLTITEGGYVVDPDDAAVRRDLEHGEAPRTAFGLITEALRRRRERDLAPFTVVPCDNLEGNGELTRERVTGFARMRDAELGEWIERAGRFPNSMVDRITGATTAEDQRDLAARAGIEDRWPVVCEAFSQWVIEGDFTTQRPPLERVGVQVVDDVRPYELMKLRLLNGAHQALGYLAYLAGHRLVHEAAGDPLFRELLVGYMDEEAAPTLAPVPGIDLDGYKRTLLDRFSNAAVRDTLDRLCAYTSDRIPIWLFPIVLEQLEKGGDIRRCATVIAGWARYLEGVDEAGEPIAVIDRVGDRLHARACRQREDPLALLDDELFAGLRDEPRFVEAYRTALTSLHQHGARATVQSLVDSTHQQDDTPRRVHG